MSGTFKKNFRTRKGSPFIIYRMYVKRFLEWIGLKERLHNKLPQAPHVSEGDIWWASVGENVGSEINGKSRLFSRPVVIYRKLSHGFYLVIPVTSQARTGNWYVPFRQGGKADTACLHQTRAIDYRRLSSRLGELDDEDFRRIIEGFYKLYFHKKIPPH